MAFKQRPTCFGRFFSPAGGGAKRKKPEWAELAFSASALQTQPFRRQISLSKASSPRYKSRCARLITRGSLKTIQMVSVLEGWIDCGTSDVGICHHLSQSAMALQHKLAVPHGGTVPLPLKIKQERPPADKMYGKNIENHHRPSPGPSFLESTGLEEQRSKGWQSEPQSSSISIALPMFPLPSSDPSTWASPPIWSDLRWELRPEPRRKMHHHF